MASVRELRYERIIFSFTRHGLKTVFVEGIDFNDEDVEEACELIFSEEEYDDLIKNLDLGFMC